MKISNYPEVEALNEDDLLVISRPGQGTKSVSIRALAELLAAGVGNAVANNLNVTEEGYILDARQGKVLGDRDNYSTEEHVVGKWIDGKPLYEKIIDCGTCPQCTSTGSRVSKSISVTNLNISIAVELFMSARFSNNNVQLLGGTIYANSTTVLGISANFGQSSIDIYNNNTAWNTARLTARIRYTKTTD